VPFPSSESELLASGYTLFKKTYCRKCGVPIQFWNTPNNKLMPMNQDLKDSHFATCPAAEEFRKGKSRSGAG